MLLLVVFMWKCLWFWFDGNWLNYFDIGGYVDVVWNGGEVVWVGDKFFFWGLGVFSDLEGLEWSFMCFWSEFGWV